MLTLINKFIN